LISDYLDMLYDLREHIANKQYGPLPHKRKVHKERRMTMPRFIIPPRIATAKTCALRWSGKPDGINFRCAMCGYKFKEGDVYQSLFTNDLDPPYTGNPLVCDVCRSEESSLVDRWKEKCDRVCTPSNWWFFRNEEY
jgi:hypothetical protein